MYIVGVVQLVAPWKWAAGAETLMSPSKPVRHPGQKVILVDSFAYYRNRGGTGRSSCGRCCDLSCGDKSNAHAHVPDEDCSSTRYPHAIRIPLGRPGFDRDARSAGRPSFGIPLEEGQIGAADDFPDRLESGTLDPMRMRTHQNCLASNSPHHTDHYPLYPLRRNPGKVRGHVPKASKGAGVKLGCGGRGG